MKHDENKALNNVQKTKLEAFLDKKKHEVKDQIRTQYSKLSQEAKDKIEKNTPQKVRALYKQWNDNKEKRRELEDKEAELEKALDKEGYCVASYSKVLEIYNIHNRPEMQKISAEEDKKLRELEKCFEMATLKVWTGSQSEAMGIIDEMVKAMQKIAK